MWKRFESQADRQTYSLTSRLIGIGLGLLLGVALLGCYTTFRPPSGLATSPPISPPSADSTTVTPAPEVTYNPINYYSNPWSGGWNAWAPPYSGFYPYWYYNNNPWRSYYYDPWWGNSWWYDPYPYYPNPTNPGSSPPPLERSQRGRNTQPFPLTPPPPSIINSEPPPNPPPPPPDNQQQENNNQQQEDRNRRGRGK